MRFSLVLAALAVSTVAFAQDGNFQIGYAANLNIGDSVVNISNDGFNGGVFGAGTTGNMCANIYVFDPQEEEIGCCSCLVTPNGLNSLSVKSDLISNNLTPAVPTSVIIKIIGTFAAVPAGGTTNTLCQPAVAGLFAAGLGFTNGLLAWGTTLEPASTPGTYSPVDVPFLNGTLSNASQVLAPGSELGSLRALCGFIQADGTGYGICKSCRLGALGGSKQ